MNGNDQHPHSSSHHFWGWGANRSGFASAHVGRIGVLAVALGIGTAVATGFCTVCAARASAEVGQSGTSSSGPANSAPSHAAASESAKPAATRSASRGASAGLAVKVPSQTRQAVSAPIATARVGVRNPVSDALRGNAPVIPADTAVAAMLSAARRPTTQTGKTAAQTTTTTVITPTPVEGEKMTLSTKSGWKTVTDRTASGGSALVLTSSTTASTTVNLPDTTGLVIRAKSTLSSGAPNMTVSVDGQPVTTVVVNGTSWSNYTFLGAIPAGSHVISISSTNSTTKRSLYIDALSSTTGPYVEDFTGSAGQLPTSGSWNIRTGTGWDPGVENYQTSNVALDGNGNLVLKATKSGTSYASGWVDTKNKVSFGYGTITARVKVPAGQGLWPAFWLKGANEDTVPWPKSGEIDVFELPSTTTTIYNTLHGPITGSTGTQQAQIISTVPDLSADYHNYWVTRLPNSITFGVDDQTLGTLTPDSLSPGSQWVYNQPQQLLLNLAVGGGWAGAPNSSTPFPATMTVDWVRWDPPATV